MKISVMIRESLEKRGLRHLKESSRFLGISTELLRMIVNKGHVPKDKTLVSIAERLDLDVSTLVLAAHRETVPQEMKGYFLSPVSTAPSYATAIRKYPLSQEQCLYLSQVMSAEEIQLIRKLRQVPEDFRKQVIGYVDYMFATKRVYRQ
jgi:hypothetical protein